MDRRSFLRQLGGALLTGAASAAGVLAAAPRQLPSAGDLWGRGAAYPFPSAPRHIRVRWFGDLSSSGEEYLFREGGDGTWRVAEEYRENFEKFARGRVELRNLGPEYRTFDIVRVGARS